ncbi:MAG TPA: hypothetical protein VEC09_03385 [Actinomycetota bacterium]|nr:hypothetical protein [Actinomycetota bacterium]
MPDPGRRSRATSTTRPRPVVEEVPPAAQGAGDAERGALVCNVAFCPICMAVTTARTVAPEAIDHLLAAAREFFLAARAVIDVRADDLEGETPPSSGTHLEKIEIG